MRKSPSKISYGDTRSIMSDRQSLASGSGSIVSEIYVKKKTYMRYKWESNWQYIILTLASTVTIESVYAVTISGRADDPNIIHFIVAYIVVGLPICYMQTVMGQYSLLGTTMFKYIAPISHGVGYTLLINTFVKCIYFGMLMGDFLIYLLSCMRKNLGWMICPEHALKKCWGKNNKGSCQEECINEDVEISSALFFKEIYLRGAHEEDVLKMGYPILERSVTAGACWLLVYIILIMGISRYKTVLKLNFIVIVICMLILIIVCMIPKGAFKGILLIFYVTFDSLTSFRAWAITCHQLIGVMSLETACHITFGSYMTPDAPSDILVSVTVFFHFLVTTVAAVITHACLGILMEEAKTSIDNADFIWHEKILYFSTLPQGLGFLGVPQLWTIIYFLIVILMLLNYNVAQLDTFDRCIADIHPQMRNYRSYIIAAFCIMGTISAVIWSSAEAYEIREEIFEVVFISAKTFDVLLMCIFVFWIYRVQRLADDIHFFFGSQITIFWKICWYIMPIILGWCHISYSYLQDFFGMHVVLRTLTLLVLISPIPIMAIIATFSYLKKQNLVGVLQPEERWGPPDPQERHLRHMFNPREETRSRRRNDACKHNCFLGSKVMDRALEAEDMYRNDSLEQLELEYEHDIDR